MLTSQDSRRLAHRGDPASSQDAAAALNTSTRTRIKQAILDLLEEAPRAAFEVQKAYVDWRFVYGWPDVQPHSVNRRLSELHRDGLVRATGERRAWEVVR